MNEKMQLSPDLQAMLPNGQIAVPSDDRKLDDGEYQRIKLAEASSPQAASSDCRVARADFTNLSDLISAIDSIISRDSAVAASLDKPLMAR